MHHDYTRKGPQPLGPHTIWGIHMHLPLLLALLVALVPVTATADTRAEIRNVILEGLS